MSGPRNAGPGALAEFRAAKDGSLVAVPEIVRLYAAEHLTMQQVADKTGLTFDQVRGVVNRAKVTRPRGNPAVPPREAAAIVAACKGGLNRRQAAKRFGRSTATIGKVLREGGALPVPGGALPGSDGGGVRNGLIQDRPYLSQPQKDMLAAAAASGQVRLSVLPGRLDRTAAEVWQTARSLAATGMAVIECGHGSAWLVITAQGRHAAGTVTR